MAFDVVQDGAVWVMTSRTVTADSAGWRKWCEENPDKCAPKGRDGGGSAPTESKLDKVTDDPAGSRAFGDEARDAREAMGGRLSDQVDTYAGHRYKEVNDGLRGQAPLSDESAATVAALDEAFADHAYALPGGASVLRGVAREHAEGVLALEPGAVYVDDAYTSATLSPSVAARFASKTVDRDAPAPRDPVTRERLPFKGGAVIEVRAGGSRFLHANASESEVLLDRGTSMRVVSVDRAERRVVMEVV